MALTPTQALQAALPFAVALAVGGCAAMMHGHPELARAHAEIAGEGGITGTATFTEYAHGNGRMVRVHLKVKGDPALLTPGKHGVHLHEVGECVAPFKSAGGHFDPGPAGNSDPDVNHPFHMGDLPNLDVNEKGEGEFDAMTTRVTITDGPLTLFDANGSALILHKNPDQGISGPAKSGVSGGPRLACGVIVRD
jgi:Cu-Zn family superoxide dismutase